MTFFTTPLPFCACRTWSPQCSRISRLLSRLIPRLLHFYLFAQVLVAGRHDVAAVLLRAVQQAVVGVGALVGARQPLKPRIFGQAQRDSILFDDDSVRENGGLGVRKSAKKYTSKEGIS